ncbi:GIY-YIG nuclease family protein [Candidatus Beckwithbacteria bacterium]|nr:GIY-YIG nuclease family protein [Candidatus Beckwithbacteria bacterium]
MANSRPTLYIGVTNNLLRRVYEHKNESIKGFTQKYHLHKLVYFEEHGGEREAVAREKRLKNMHRDKKLDLIKSINSNFEDLFEKINS